MLTMGRRKFRSPQRMAAPVRQSPSPQEEGTGGSRRGVGGQDPLHAMRSKEFFGGRPSAGEVPQGLPLAEDPWSSGEPLASPFPHWRRPGFRSPSMGSRVAQGEPLIWRYEARPVPVKKAQCL